MCLPPLVDNACLPKDGVDRNPCQNGAKCEFKNGEVTCSCPVPYEGPTCAGNLKLTYVIHHSSTWFMCNDQEIWYRCSIQRVKHAVLVIENIFVQFLPSESPKVKWSRQSHAFPSISPFKNPVSRMKQFRHRASITYFLLWKQRNSAQPLVV